MHTGDLRWVVYVCVTLGVKEGAATIRRYGVVMARNATEAIESAKRRVCSLGLPCYGIDLYRADGVEHFAILRRMHERSLMKSWSNVPRRGPKSAAQPQDENEDPDAQVEVLGEEVPMGTAEDCETAELALRGRLTTEE